MASGPKWPWPGTRFIKDRVNGSKRRWGPMKHVALFVDPWLIKSWFSAAFMSSPKCTERSPSLPWYSAKTSWPPGKEWWSPPVVEVTSQGSRRVVTLMTVSRWPDDICCAVHGKASMDAYLAPTSLEKERRSIIFLAASVSEKFLVFASCAKNRVLHPAT